MTVHLFNARSGFVSEGKNLTMVLRHAKNRGVKSIYTEKMYNSKFYKVFIKMNFNDGYYVVYNFENIGICNEYHSKRWPDIYKMID